MFMSLFGVFTNVGEMRQLSELPRRLGRGVGPQSDPVAGTNVGDVARAIHDGLAEGGFSSHAANVGGNPPAANPLRRPLATLCSAGPWWSATSRRGVSAAGVDPGSSFGSSPTSARSASAWPSFKPPRGPREPGLRR